MKKSPLPRVPRVFQRLIGHPVTLFQIHPTSQRTIALRGHCVGVTVRADPAGVRFPCLILHSGAKISHPFIRPTTLVFPEDVPVQCDVEAFSGRKAAPAVYPAAQNGCLNLIGDPKPLRAFVARNINRAFKAHDLILAVRFDDDGAGLIIRRRELPVFPEVPTAHAVVRRVREESGQGGK